MNKYVLIAVALVWISPPAYGISAFNKQWKAEYLGDGVNRDFIKKARKAGCYICHVKKHPKKKEARNEYGEAMREFLKKEDFSKERLKDESEKGKIKAEIIAGFKKTAEKLSKDGKAFGEKIADEKIPAVDWMYEKKEGKEEKKKDK